MKSRKKIAVQHGNAPAGESNSGLPELRAAMREFGGSMQHALPVPIAILLDLVLYSS
jgi:hypothetical protein